MKWNIDILYKNFILIILVAILLAVPADDILIEEIISNRDNPSINTSWLIESNTISIDEIKIANDGLKSDVNINHTRSSYFVYHSDFVNISNNYAFVYYLSDNLWEEMVNDSSISYLIYNYKINNLATHKSINLTSENRTISGNYKIISFLPEFLSINISDRFVFILLPLTSLEVFEINSLELENQMVLGDFWQFNIIIYLTDNFIYSISSSKEYEDQLHLITSRISALLVEKGFILENTEYSTLSQINYLKHQWKRIVEESIRLMFPILLFFQLMIVYLVYNDLQNNKLKYKLFRIRGFEYSKLFNKIWKQTSIFPLLVHIVGFIIISQLFPSSYFLIQYIFISSIIFQFFSTTYIAYRFYSQLVHELLGRNINKSKNLSLNFNKIIKRISIVITALIIFTLFDSILNSRSDIRIAYLPSYFSYIGYLLFLFTLFKILKFINIQSEKGNNIKFRMGYSIFQKNKMALVLMLLLTTMLSYNFASMNYYQQQSDIKTNNSIDATHEIKFGFYPSYDSEQRLAIKHNLIGNLSSLNEIDGIEKYFPIFTLFTQIEGVEYSYDTFTTVFNVSEYESYTGNNLINSTDTIFVDSTIYHSIERESEVNIDLVGVSKTLSSEHFLPFNEDLAKIASLSNLLVISRESLKSLGFNNNVNDYIHVVSIFLKVDKDWTDSELENMIAEKLSIPNYAFRVRSQNIKPFIISKVLFGGLQLISGIILSFIFLKLFYFDPNLIGILHILGVKYNLIKWRNQLKLLLLINLISFSFICSMMGLLLSLLNNKMYLSNYSFNPVYNIGKIVWNIILIQIYQGFIFTAVFLFNYIKKDRNMSI